MAFGVRGLQCGGLVGISVVQLFKVVARKLAVRDGILCARMSPALHMPLIGIYSPHKVEKGDEKGGHVLC